MKQIIILTILLIITITIGAQEPQTKELTREAILEMTIEELSDLPLEDLMKALDLVGVSSLDELYELIMNKNVQSASKRNENAFDSPLSSSVLTKEEIITYGATTFEEALRLIPGIIVREKTNGNFDVHLRGLDNVPDNNMLLYSENTNTLLMIDGRPSFNYANGTLVWESLPIGFEDIEKIEVVRGPSSALYGSNAVNGVINIITAKTTSTSPIVSGSFKGGTQNTYTGDIAFRKAFNNKINAAVTGNFQSRGRDRDEINIYNQGNLYLKDGDNNFNKFEGGFIPIDQYDNIYQQYNNNYFQLKDPSSDVNKLFPDVSIARENVGVNGYLQYIVNNDININVAGGYQNSTINSSPIGDGPSSFSGRESTTSYISLNSSIGRLKLQTNYTGGVQNFATGDLGFNVDMGQFNGSVEYDYQIKSLNLRPGINYQNVFYNDLPNLAADEKGYLNGKKVLSTLGISLRADYLAFGKLRLVSALKTEKYNNPNKWYASFQFAGTLPLNDKQTIRAEFSRANRSSYMVNSHSNYIRNREGRMPPTYIHFNGSKDCELMSINMFQLGYRLRPTKNLLIDAEFFMSSSKDYGALMPDSSSITNISDIMVGKPAVTRAYITYQNLPVKAQQTGASVGIDWVISKKVIAKFHSTIQKTYLDNYSSINRNGIIIQQLTEATAKIPSAIAAGKEQVTSAYKPTDLTDNVEHENTPTFWGMVGLIYKPTTKLTFSSYGYYYSEQTMKNINETINVSQKFILNFQAGYKPTKKTELYLNARNLLNDKSEEFAFMDEIGGIYMLGLRFEF